MGIFKKMKEKKEKEKKAKQEAVDRYLEEVVFPSLLFKRILKLDYSNMIKIAKAVSKKTNKNLLFILFDMTKCGLKYQAGYYDYQEFEFYNLNKEQRETYLTRGKNNEIIKKFNDKSKFYIFDNKEEMYKIYNKFLKRQWMVLNENNYNDFLDFFKQNKVIIVKPIDGEGGKGIEKYEYINDEESKIVYSSLLFKKQLLVEQCIKQHPDMNKLYNKSVNTLRMFTFYKDGQAYFLQAILKVGNGGVVDNFSSGGMYTYVDDEGTVYAEAIDQMDNKYYKHPISNETIVGFKVPMFKEAVSMVKEAAKVVPEMGYIGWDVAISEDGPVLVEGNCYPGVFQVKPSLVEKKEGIIPKYNKVMQIFGNCYNANNSTIQRNNFN